MSGVSPGEQKSVAGLFPAQWLSIMQSCFLITGYGIAQLNWPNGKSLLEQSAKLVRIFDIIKTEISDSMSRARKG